MEKNKVTCITFHNPFNMGGVNFGNKIDTAVRKDIEMIDDIGRNRVWIKFKGITTFVPDSNIVAGSVQTIPADIQAMFEPTESEEIQAGPPAVARSRRTKAEMEAARVHDEAAAFDPNDTSPEAHRARVRAASANAHKPDGVHAQNDLLIQEARNAAAGVKFKAQVSNPTQPAQGASVVGKTKALTHAQMRAQVAKEAAE